MEDSGSELKNLTWCEACRVPMHVKTWHGQIGMFSFLVSWHVVSVLHVTQSSQQDILYLVYLPNCQLLSLASYTLLYQHRSFMVYSSSLSRDKVEEK